MTHSTIDLIGVLPVAAILVAQAVARDEVWLVANLLFLVYHAFATHLQSQLACSFILVAICLVRILRKQR